jgi:hypothetical protein
MRLDDFLVLGRTVPEASQHYGTRVCMAGYSEELGRIIRVYPLLIDTPLKSRYQATLELTRNSDDNRHESYKLRDAVTSIYGVSSQPHWSTSQVVDLADKMHYPSIAELNRQRLSLGFIALRSTPILTFKGRDASPQGPQLTLFEEFVEDLRRTNFWTGRDYPQVPYVTFQDGAGEHTLQLREWGTFEYLRKHKFAGEGLDQALHLRTAGEQWYALVGNMAHRRNVWLVIQLVHRPPTLFAL